MNTLIDKIKSAAYQEGYIVVTLESGLEIRFPISGNERLSGGTPEQLSHIELSPFGLHWPELDEDLSFRGLLEGCYGQTRTCPAGSSQNGSSGRTFEQYLRQMPDVGEDTDFARITGSIREAHLAD